MAHVSAGARGVLADVSKVLRLRCVVALALLQKFDQAGVHPLLNFSLLVVQVILLEAASSHGYLRNCLWEIRRVVSQQ
jgi:hypothetical protein